VIGYGIVQAATPRLLRSRVDEQHEPDGRTATVLAFVLAALPAGIALALSAGVAPAIVVVAGLIVFGVVFALNSAVHSYLILAYTDSDKVAMNVGFYYMANAGRASGRHGPLGCSLSMGSAEWPEQRSGRLPMGFLSVCSCCRLAFTALAT
jgi:hypothetical protein